MSCTSVGVFQRGGNVVEVGFGRGRAPIQCDTLALQRDAERSGADWSWVAFYESQLKSVRAALPGRPWYDAELARRAAPSGFEDVVWPPSMAALGQLLHGDIKKIVEANTGRCATPWVFRVSPCAVVRAVVGAEHVLEDEAGNVAVVGLPFPEVDAVGRVLIGTAVKTGGVVCLGPRRQSGAMPPGHRRRNSSESAEPRVWLGTKAAEALIKLPYETAWQSPQGIVWPAACNERFWTVAWPKVVAAKAKDVQRRRQLEFGETAENAAASVSAIHALIKRLGLPEQPGCLDARGKPISAERARARQREWAKLLKRKTFNAKFVPRCPARNWPASSNAVTRFCPADEAQRCTRTHGATVSTVIEDGQRPPCMAIAIERGGNEARFQAAGILACATAALARSPSPGSSHEF